MQDHIQSLLILNPILNKNFHKNILHVRHISFPAVHEVKLHGFGLFGVPSINIFEQSLNIEVTFYLIVHRVLGHETFVNALFIGTNLVIFGDFFVLEVKACLNFFIVFLRSDQNRLFVLEYNLHN